MQEKKLSEIDEAAMEEELEVLNLSVMKRYIFFRKVGCQWIAESFRLIPAENVSGDIYCVLTNTFDLEPDFIERDAISKCFYDSLNRNLTAISC